MKAKQGQKIYLWNNWTIIMHNYWIDKISRLINGVKGEKFRSIEARARLLALEKGQMHKEVVISIFLFLWLWLWKPYNKTLYWMLSRTTKIMRSSCLVVQLLSTMRQKSPDWRVMEEIICINNYQFMLPFVSLLQFALHGTSLLLWKMMFYCLTKGCNSPSMFCK